ncbi:ABC transporter B family member 15-like, partial [Trifolium medium]|nr:ABC transporter B family member 15-like [Trifolium medium]
MGGVDNRKWIDLFKKEKKNKNGSIWSIFMHADREDWLLMVLGTIGAIGE